MPAPEDGPETPAEVRVFLRDQAARLRRIERRMDWLLESLGVQSPPDLAAEEPNVTECDAH